MKQAYVEPEVQVLRLNLEMSILNGGSNEGFDDTVPGEWAPPGLPSIPGLPSFPF